VGLVGVSPAGYSPASQARLPLTSILSPWRGEADSTDTRVLISREGEAGRDKDPHSDLAAGSELGRLSSSEEERGG